MGANFHLGRIAGIRIGVNWSVLVIFFLITWGLAGSWLPRFYPGHSTVAYWVTGLLAGLVFFLSLLAHELSHALVARRNGLGVQEITLWLFGGVARLHGEARSPSADFRIAGVGPLVSLVLGVVFLVSAGLLALSGYSGLVLASLEWLGGINIMLAVFNSIPAAPLDGGRLLRSFLWWRSGDRYQATVRASRAGQVFGWLLIVLGLVQLFLRPGVDGLWLALIGWFIVGAASAESRQADLRNQLGQLRVDQVMTRDPVVAPGSMSVARFLTSELSRHDFATFPLVDEVGRPIGLVAAKRLRRLPRDKQATLLRDIGTPVDQVARLHPHDSAADLLTRLAECAENRALVLDDDTLVGIVSPADITAAMQWLNTPGSFQRRLYPNQPD